MSPPSDIFFSVFICFLLVYLHSQECKLHEKRELVYLVIVISWVHRAVCLTHCMGSINICAVIELINEWMSVNCALIWPQLSYHITSLQSLGLRGHGLLSWPKAFLVCLFSQENPIYPSVEQMNTWVHLFLLAGIWWVLVVGGNSIKIIFCIVALKSI